MKPLSVARSILKPVSLVELSVHARLICVVEAVVADKPLGVDGEPAIAGETLDTTCPRRISS